MAHKSASYEFRDAARAFSVDCYCAMHHSRAEILAARHLVSPLQSHAAREAHAIVLHWLAAHVARGQGTMWLMDVMREDLSPSTLLAMASDIRASARRRAWVRSDASAAAVAVRQEQQQQFQHQGPWPVPLLDRLDACRRAHQPLAGTAAAHISDLPAELLALILSYSARGARLARSARVCRTWREAAAAVPVWRDVTRTAIASRSQTWHGVFHSLRTLDALVATEVFCNGVAAYIDGAGVRAAMTATDCIPVLRCITSVMTHQCRAIPADRRVPLSSRVGRQRAVTAVVTLLAKFYTEIYRGAVTDPCLLSGWLRYLLLPDVNLQLQLKQHDGAEAAPTSSSLSGPLIMAQPWANAMLGARCESRWQHCAVWLPLLAAAIECGHGGESVLDETRRMFVHIMKRGGGGDVSDEVAALLRPHAPLIVKAVCAVRPCGGVAAVASHAWHGLCMKADTLIRRLDSNLSASVNCPLHSLQPLDVGDADADNE